MNDRYLLLDLAFLCLVFLLDLRILGTRVSAKKQTWKTVFCLLFLTALFDNFLTGLPIVQYNSAYILNIRLGYAPIEDFSYALATGILVPALYTYFNKKNA